MNEGSNSTLPEELSKLNKLLKIAHLNVIKIAHLIENHYELFYHLLSVELIADIL